MGPQFSERTFEFCYNAEFCHRYSGILAAHPNIPSQRAERALGYDVEFEIRTGRFHRSVFLQHKVSHFAESKSGRNARFYNRHSGAYYRFPVDTEQHNVLHQLSQDTGSAFYCSPIFIRRIDLEANFRANSIMTSSLWLDPVEVGPIFDAEKHHITYGVAGDNPTLHSEPREFRKPLIAEAEKISSIRPIDIDYKFIEQLSENLIAETKRTKRWDKRPDGAAAGDGRTLQAVVEEGRPVERVQILLGQVYGVSWLLLP